MKKHRTVPGIDLVYFYAVISGLMFQVMVTAILMCAISHNQQIIGYKQC